MNTSEREYQEKLSNVYREAAFDQLNKEIGSLVVTAQTSVNQEMPLVDAIESVLESNK